MLHPPPVLPVSFAAVTIVPRVVEDRRILLHPRRAHAEVHAREMVVHRIEIDRHAVGVGILIAPGETSRDQRRLRIEQPHSHIQRFIVVQQPHLGALGCRLAFIRILLP